MPGELKNLVALAISSGSAKYHQPQQQRQRQPEKKNLVEGEPEAEREVEGRRTNADKKQTQSARRSKGESSGGSKRITKLLSKSVAPASSRPTITTSSIPFTPPTSDPTSKKAPVASPESDASSLLNGGSCVSAGPLLAEQIAEDTPKVQPKWKGPERTILSNMDGDNGEKCVAEDASECDRPSVSLAHQQNSTDAYRAAETDDETILDSVRSAGYMDKSTGKTNGETASSGRKESSERPRGWYATRKSYRSVAYKTWTVGAARKLLNSSRSDYDLPPTHGTNSTRSGTKIGIAKIVDGSVSDGEDKFYNCTYTRSQDDDLSGSICLSAGGRIQEADVASAPLHSVSPLLDKVKARKCASSDAVTHFTISAAAANEPGSFLSPVDSVPSTSSDSAPITHSQCQSTGNGHMAEMESHDAERIESSSVRPSGEDEHCRRVNCGPNLDGQSWLLMASSSSDDVCKNKIGKIQNRNDRERGKVNGTGGGKCTGDCFSSEDYFKFTLKKRLFQQQHQHSQDQFDTSGNVWPSILPQRNVTPPLLALDREIRSALNNSHPNNMETRCDSPGRQLKTRSSSPTTLSSLVAAAQQRWRQQSERFARKIERTSCRAKITSDRPTDGVKNILEQLNVPPPPPAKIPPLDLSSSSFSSTSSSSSSMSWISQRAAKPQQKQKAVAFSPLAISADRDEERASNDHTNSVKSLCTGSRTSRANTTTNGATSPFQCSHEAVQFLKLELEKIRKKDHQILSQLKILDAEICRRKSETDALSSCPFSIDEEEFENAAESESKGERIQSGITGRPSERSGRLEGFHLSNGTPTGPFNHPSLHTAVPPLPKCLQVNFKTL